MLKSWDRISSPTLTWIEFRSSVIIASEEEAKSHSEDIQETFAHSKSTGYRCSDIENIFAEWLRDTGLKVSLKKLITNQSNLWQKKLTEVLERDTNLSKLEHSNSVQPKSKGLK